MDFQNTFPNIPSIGHGKQKLKSQPWWCDVENLPFKKHPVGLAFKVRCSNHWSLSLIVDSTDACIQALVRGKVSWPDEAARVWISVEWEIIKYVDQYNVSF